MVRRLLLIPLLCGLWLCSLADRAESQTRPAAAKPADTAKPAANVAKEAPPKGAPPVVADPKLDRVLLEWFNSSKAIQKLEGEHHRFVYDYQWNVVKKADGQFYYEAPGKGRIDLIPSKVKPAEKAEKVHPVDGKKVVVVVEPDIAQRWVCDGAKVLEIDDAAKAVTEYPIPKEAQGANIMDGPLPFLFGLPPEKAKQRFNMRLVSETDKRYILQAVPKLQQDAANYKWAVVILERQTMLPEAVQMLDPAEMVETVYTFPRVEKNPRRRLFGFAEGLFGGDPDPFKPNLKNYKLIEQGQGQAKIAAAAGQQQKKPISNPAVPGPANGEPVVPSVIGLHHEKARQILEARGYVAKFYEGNAATVDQEKFHAYHQNPAPKTPLAQGQVVKVQLYVEPPIATTKATEKPGRKPNAMPDLRGLNWKEADAELKAAGYEVRYRRGSAANKASDINKVQSQSPAAGERLPEGGTVELTIFVDPNPKK